MQQFTIPQIKDFVSIQNLPFDILVQTGSGHREVMSNVKASEDIEKAISGIARAFPSQTIYIKPRVKNGNSTKKGKDVYEVDTSSSTALPEALNGFQTATSTGSQQIPQGNFSNYILSDLQNKNRSLEQELKAYKERVDEQKETINELRLTIRDKDHDIKDKERDIRDAEKETLKAIEEAQKKEDENSGLNGVVNTVMDTVKQPDFMQTLMGFMAMMNQSQQPQVAGQQQPATPAIPAIEEEGSLVAMQVIDQLKGWFAETDDSTIMKFHQLSQIIQQNPQVLEPVLAGFRPRQPENTETETTN